MEFHDILHGLIRFTDENLTPLLADLLGSPEIHRLRNMRQMNFDVPLIQELGRSRRLPHSIGVTNLAVELAHKGNMSVVDSKILLTAAMLHDAAIPPYGHLVESEFKRIAPDFNHESILAQLINGKINEMNQYQEIVPNKQLGLHQILDRHDVDIESVMRIVCPSRGKSSPVSSDIDIDNIDNVHRMAAMLGWDNARENFNRIRKEMKLRGLNGLIFSDRAIEPLDAWLDFRQRIYTLIIAHPECIPYNALQADLIRGAVDNGIITPAQWYVTEPEFEESLRKHPATKGLASQLISGCDYQLVDYVWFKNFEVSRKIPNAEVAIYMGENVDPGVRDSGYFVWNEKGLICREIAVPCDDGSRKRIGKNSTSCMVALIRKSVGKEKRTKQQSNRWRQDVVSSFVKLFGSAVFEIDYPEGYTGSYYGVGTNELQLGYN